MGKTLMHLLYKLVDLWMVEIIHIVGLPTFSTSTSKPASVKQVPD